MHIRAERLLAPWVFVLTGILFNILSAVITHYFIGLNNDAINEIDRNIHRQQVLIDSLWQSRVEVERKKEFFFLLLSNPVETPEAGKAYYREYLQELLTTHGLQAFQPRLDSETGSELELLLDISDAAQQGIIKTINDTYFETLKLSEARMPLESDNSRLFSIAIFLQVIGLILVLARDLWRR